MPAYFLLTFSKKTKSSLSVTGCQCCWESLGTVGSTGRQMALNPITQLPTQYFTLTLSNFHIHTYDMHTWATAIQLNLKHPFAKKELICHFIQQFV